MPWTRRTHCVAPSAREMRANSAQFLLLCSVHAISRPIGVEVIADPAPLYIWPLKYSASSASSMSSCDAYSSSGYSFFHNSEPSSALNLATIAEHTTWQSRQYSVPDASPATGGLQK